MNYSFAVYADIDLNIIDGSSIWVQSISLAISQVPNAKVFLFLKTSVDNPEIVKPLEKIENIEIVDPAKDSAVKNFSRSLSPFQISQLIIHYDKKHNFDAIVVRQVRVAKAFSQNNLFHNRLWTYLTDIPQSPGAFTKADRDTLGSISNASRYILCQTEEMRSLWDCQIPEAGRKTIVLPPMVLSVCEAPKKRVRDRSNPRLIYIGKFAPFWNALQISKLHEYFEYRKLPVLLTLVGSKIHKNPDDMHWRSKVLNNLETTHPKKNWVGGVSREEAMEHCNMADFGLSWRSSELDSSLELSTKVLEYGSRGLPVFLNDTSKHREILGSDYPYFVQSESDIADHIKESLSNPDNYALAAKKCWDASRLYTLENTAKALTDLIKSVKPEWPTGHPAPVKPIRICVAYHDPKFFTEIENYIQTLDNVTLKRDVWHNLREHNIEHSKSMRDWADIVICEWFAGNVVWYSNNKKKGQKLIVRFHRFEKDTEFPKLVNIEAVDTVVCVNNYYKALVQKQFNWSAEKVVTIGNWVNHQAMDRPKLPGARWRIGMIGAAPSRKRLDRAVEVLSLLKQRDKRFSLWVKGKQPWLYPYIWARKSERDAYKQVFHRINSDPNLRDSVIFEPFAADIGEYLRKIGSMLSVSDDESFHLAPAEAMMSRAIASIIRWPGAETVYNEEWISDDINGVAERIYEICSNQALWLRKGEEAKKQVSAKFTMQYVCSAWASLILTHST